MTRSTLRARLSYAFDNSLSRGPVALIGWLGLASAAVVVGVSLLVWATGVAPEYGLSELLWMSLMRTLDAGTMGGDVGSWPFLLSMFGVTMGGVFVISMLIGVLTTGLEERLQDLRKGRSRVVESGHTVILGWSEQVYSVVAQLALANANQRRACIVVLADRDKVEMEDELVLIGDLIARIIAQTCRQSGLSVVYNELLDFGDSELYTQTVPELTGQAFREALLAFEDSALLGIHPDGGSPHLNPPMDAVIGPEDRLIVLSEDDDTIHPTPGRAPAVDRGAIRRRPPVEACPERTLILGWNWRAPAIITEMDRYVAPGSEVAVVADLDGAGDEVARVEALLTRQRITFRCGDTTDREVLNVLGVETYDHVVILCYGDTLDPQQADARTLVTLLHLRDISERSDHPFSIVTEMQDMRNRELAEVTRADDYIVSDRLVSLVLAQISENKTLNAIFRDLLDPEGSEIYLKPAGDYVATNTPVSYYTVVAASAERGEVAMGYRLGALAGDAARHYGVVLNPRKSEVVTFGEGDRVIVLAES